MCLILKYEDIYGRKIFSFWCLVASAFSSPGEEVFILTPLIDDSVK